MDFTQLLKELEAERKRGISEFYKQLEKAVKENTDIMPIVVKELETKQESGISELYTQLEKAVKEKADILSVLKKHFVVDEDNNEDEEDSE
jgi:hypothetical protein